MKGVKTCDVTGVLIAMPARAAGGSVTVIRMGCAEEKTCSTHEGGSIQMERFPEKERRQVIYQNGARMRECLLCRIGHGFPREAPR